MFFLIIKHRFDRFQIVSFVLLVEISLFFIVFFKQQIVHDDYIQCRPFFFVEITFYMWRGFNVELLRYFFVDSFVVGAAVSFSFFSSYLLIHLYNVVLGIRYVSIISVAVFSLFRSISRKKSIISLV